MKKFLKFILAFFMISAGVFHLLRPQIFIAIVPSYLPFPNQLVFISGIFEILGGIGLCIPSFQKAAAWGLAALFIAVFPANINMAVNHLPFAGSVHPVLLWLRLPLQAVFVLWAWWYT